MLSTGTSSSRDISPTEQAFTSGSEKHSFFGTPPEPLFNHEKTGLCPELIQKSLQGLAKLNDRTVLRPEEIELHNCLVTKNSATFFFLTCRHLNLPLDIQYRAIDIFVRFMTRHVTELYAHVQSTRNSSSPIEWETVQDRLTHQVTLRAVTCIQLASKMSLHYKIVGIDKARTFLSNCGFCYAANSLVQSEIRILKTLDFRLHIPSPLDYIEVILETLGYNNPSIKVKQLHDISVKLLDIFYLCSQSISERLIPHGNKSSVTVDLLLIASAIVGAAAFVLNQSSSDDIVRAISDITHIQPDNILDFAALLIEKIMKN